MKNFTWSSTHIVDNKTACEAVIKYMEEHNVEFIYKYASESEVVVMYFDDQYCIIAKGINDILNEHGVSTTWTRD